MNKRIGAKKQKTRASGRTGLPAQHRMRRHVRRWVGALASASGRLGHGGAWASTQADALRRRDAPRLDWGGLADTQDNLGRILRRAKVLADDQAKR